MEGRYPEILRQIQRGEVAPVYYLYGEDDFLREKARQKIEEALLLPEMWGFNREVFSARDSALGSLAVRAGTVPLLAPRRLLVITDVHTLSAADHEPLVAYLQDPSPTTCLLLVGETLDLRTRLARLLQEKGVLLRFRPPVGRALREWIRQRVTEEGKTATPEAVELLITLVGEDLRTLDATVQKVCLFAASEKGVDTDAVASVVGRDRVQSIFEVTDAVGRRDLPRAVASLRRLVESGEEVVGVTGMLARHYRLLLTLAVLTREGVSAPERGALLGLPPWVCANLEEQARGLSPDSLVQALSSLAEADREIKRGKGQALEDALIAFVRSSPPLGGGA